MRLSVRTKKKRFVFNSMRSFCFKERPTTRHGSKKNEETHTSQKKLICKEIFTLIKVIKIFMKTKGNGENIYKRMNALLRNCRCIFAFIKKGKKRYKERDREENAWRTVEQCLIVF